MIKVSVIVPVFNSRDTISACLDSLVGQTLDDIEIIIVDDRSDDDSVKIISEYLTAYEGNKTFTIIQSEERKGPGNARNLGLDYAGGKYIAFVDSDDFVEPDFCELLYNEAVSNQADLAACDIFLDYPGKKSKVRKNAALSPGVLSSSEKKRMLRKGARFFSTFLYRRDLLLEHQIRFPQTNIAENSCLLACSILCAGSAVSIEKPLYHYLIYPYSVSRLRDRNRFRQRLASFRYLKAFATQNGLYRSYRRALRIFTFKNGTLSAIVDFLRNNI